MQKIGFVPSLCIRLIALLLSFALAACNKKDSENEDKTVTAPPSTTPKLPVAEAAFVAPPLGSAQAKQSLEDIATTLLGTAFKASGREPNCRSYILGQSDIPSVLSIDVHEKHGDGCPGDPNTAPMVGSFRVDPFTGRVWEQNFDSGAFAVLETPLDSTWYLIEHGPERCSKTGGPETYIRELRNKGIQYETSDATENDRVVTTAVASSHTQPKVFHRGILRCAAVVLWDQDQLERDIAKYK